MQKLLILDIDETLVSCDCTCCNKMDNIKYDFDLYFGDEKYYCIKRPFLDDFLKYCKTNFRIAFWSAGEKVYVERIVDEILKNTGIEPLFVWSFEKCTKKLSFVSFFNNKTILYKKLKKVWRNKKFNCDKKNVLILDDTEITYKYNTGNAISIKKFFGKDENDTELLRVKGVLETLKDCEDVRLINKNY